MNEETPKKDPMRWPGYAILALIISFCVVFAFGTGIWKPMVVMAIIMWFIEDFPRKKK
jgi:hypothetical protein